MHIEQNTKWNVKQQNATFEKEKILSIDKFGWAEHFFLVVVFNI